jgi:hypothetical protein
MAHGASRRQFVCGALTLPIGIVSGAGCGQRKAETPLAHLYGKEWVHGAYAEYARGYLQIEQRAKKKSFDAYKVLAQKGVTALEGLQQREVPFFLKLSEDGKRYEIERDLPERLTFTAEMSAADREEATRTWNLARNHIHTDYDEIRRLNWAMTSLLRGITQVRSAIDEGEVELYRLCRRAGDLKQGGELPYELPYQVTRADYERVVYLLIDRLDQDMARLLPLEASILAVGLSSRSTDSRSASLALNVKKVLLAVADDADAAGKPPAPEYPSDEERERRLQHGRDLYQKTSATPEYQGWLKQEREKEAQEIGAFLSVLDTVTGLPTSALFRHAMKIWNGEADYLDYLELAASVVPGGGSLGGVLHQGIATTKKARQLYAQAMKIKDQAVAIHDKAIQLKDKALEAKALGEAVLAGDANAAYAAIEGAGLVNVATRAARRQINKQLVFLEDQAEVDELRERAESSWLFKQPMPELPAAPAPAATE